MSLEDTAEAALSLKGELDPVITDEPPATITQLYPAWSIEQPDTFNVGIYREGGSIRLLLEGELDMAAVAAFEVYLYDAEREAAGPIVLDLRDLTFLDCSGLHSLVSASERIAAAGGKLMVVPGPRQIQRLFQLTRVDMLFEFHAA